MRLLLPLTLALAPLSEPAMFGEILHALRVLYARAMPSSPVADSLAHSLGVRGDAASSTGTLHAKVKDIKDNPPSVINSIQRGTIAVATPATGATATDTATITAVATAKATVGFLGVIAPLTTSGAGCHGRVEPTNATTVTATAQNTQLAALTVTIGYEVVEYK